MTPSSDVSQRLSAAFDHNERICSKFSQAITLLALNGFRDPAFSANNLLTYLVNDFCACALTLRVLAKNGFDTSCHRELRYLLEASIKLCYVQQLSPASSSEEKLIQFKRDLDSPNIGIRKAVDLHFLPPALHSEFQEHVGRLYGHASNYVHMTAAQLRRRLADASDIVDIDQYSLGALSELNSRIVASLGAAFVFVAHSVPAFSVGDLLVVENGSSLDWPLATDRYVAHIDEYFDYKHERQNRIHEIRAVRWARVA